MRRFEHVESSCASPFHVSLPSQDCTECNNLQLYVQQKDCSEGRLFTPTAPARIGGYRKPLLAGQEEFLRELTASRKGTTLAEIRAALIERGVAPVSLMTIWSMLKRIDQSHKKTRLAKLAV
ncbi:hypothetical protein [Roseomonas chloroacetimidivorans]|uniref:hypothetical protein n=1 Tax=Roseomonas chloroacetimidivorans TaxID=1766656 RepID=UPI003C7770B3